MASRVVMPKLTDTMEEGVVVKWKKHEGDPVATGDVLAEIETDKAVMDLEAFASGVLRKVVAEEGQTVPAGALIGVIGEPDEDIAEAMADGISASAGAQATRRAAPGKPAPSPPQTAPAAPRGPSSDTPKERPASPRARTRAAELGVELTDVSGTGPGGRVTERDVLEAAGGRRAVPTPGDRPLSQMRKAIARATTQSKAPVPHFYLTAEIDMDEAVRFREQWKASRRSHPSLTDLILKAVAITLTRHPEINVSYTGEAIRQHATIDLGLAVGMEDGLITPVLRNCGAKSLTQIVKETRDLIGRCRKRQLQPEEYRGATFTVSNLGMYDVQNFIAVIMPPEAAALAVGAVREVAVIEDGAVRPARRMSVTLSCDHRIIDGVQGAEFLRTLRQVLERPIQLVLPEESE